MKNSHLAIIRLAHPLAFASFLRNIGAPVEGYFRKQGLPTLCEDPNAFVSIHKTWLFFDEAARREDLMLGWQVGKYVGDHNLSAALIKKLEDSPTLYRALSTFVRLIRSEGSHIQIGIREYQSGIMFFTHYAGMSEEAGYHISQAYQLGIVIDLIRHYAGRDWQPKEIGVEISAIPSLIGELYPGSIIRVNQPVGYVIIPRSCLHMELRRYHRNVDGTRSLSNTEGLNDAQILDLLLGPYLPHGYPTMQFAASLMEYSTRTLARRLAACGKSYQTLIDETRFREARSLLTSSDAPIKEVALRVGFNDQAHFSRMFRRVGGLGPGHFRRLARDGNVQFGRARREA